MSVRPKFHRGAWWVFIHWKGQRKKRRFGEGPAGKKAAELFAVKLAARLAGGGLLEEEREPAPTFKEAAGEWLRRYASLQNPRPSTLALRTHYVEKHLVPFFADRRIDTITAEDVENLIEAKRAAGGALRGKALSDRTIKGGVLLALRMILDRAVRQKWTSENPLRGGDRLWQPQVPDVQPDPFGTSELGRLIAAAQAINALWALRLRIWVQGGLRSGELRALIRADYDAQAGTVTVSRSRTHGRTGETKTKRSRRIVTITHPVCEATQEWRPGTTPESWSVVVDLARLVPIDLGAPLLPSLRDPSQPMDESEQRNLWERTIRRAQVRYRSPEQLRHTFVSTMLERGASPLYVASQTGHAPAVMFRYYAKLPPQDMSSAPGRTLDAPSPRRLDAN